MLESVSGFEFDITDYEFQSTTNPGETRFRTDRTESVATIDRDIETVTAFSTHKSDEVVTMSGEIVVQEGAAF